MENEKPKASVVLGIIYMVICAIYGVGLLIFYILATNQSVSDIYAPIISAFNLVILVINPFLMRKCYTKKSYGIAMIIIGIIGFFNSPLEIIAGSLALTYIKEHGLYKSTSTNSGGNMRGYASSKYERNLDKVILNKSNQNVKPNANLGKLKIYVFLRYFAILECIDILISYVVGYSYYYSPHKIRTEPLLIAIFNLAVGPVGIIAVILSFISSILLIIALIRLIVIMINKKHITNADNVLCLLTGIFYSLTAIFFLIAWIIQINYFVGLAFIMLYLGAGVTGACTIIASIIGFKNQITFDPILQNNYYESPRNNVSSSLRRNTVASREDKFYEIQKYKELYDKGIITKQEFEKKKKELLNI